MKLLFICLVLLIEGKVDFNDIFKLKETVTLRAESLLINPPFDECHKIDSKGNHWIVDNVNMQLLKFSPEGKLLKIIGREGRGPKEFKFPSSIYIDNNDRVYVADLGNRRISIFDNDGKFLDSFIPFNECHVVRVDYDGNIYVGGVGLSHLIGKYDPKGRHKKSFYPTKRIEMELRMGIPIVMDIGKIKEKEYIYVMHVSDAMISIFNLNGKKRRTFFHYPPSYKPFASPGRMLSSDEAWKFWKKIHEESIEPLNLVTTSNGYLFAVFRVPKPKSCIIDIYDAEGNLLIENIKSERFLICTDKDNCLWFSPPFGTGRKIGELTYEKYSFHIPTNISE